MSDPGNVAHQDKAKDNGKTTPPPADGQVPSPIKHAEKQSQAKQADHSHHFRPQAKLNLEGDEKCIIGKSMADSSLVSNFIPKGMAKFRPVDELAEGTLAIPGSSTIVSDNPNLIPATAESSKAPHEHKKVETKGSDTKQKPRSVDVPDYPSPNRATPEPSKANYTGQFEPVLGKFVLEQSSHDHKKVEAKGSDQKQKKSRPIVGSKENVAPKKSPNVVEVHKQESGSKGKAKGNHEQKKKPRSADAIEPKKKSADNRKSNKNQHVTPKEKETEEVSPPVVGKKTTDSKTKTGKGSQTKVVHTKAGDHSNKSHEKIKTIVPGDHNGKSKTKSDGKHKPKSADK